MKKNLFKLVLVLFSLVLVGWGSVGHRIINRSTTLSFPTELNFLLFWADSLAAHGSDADIRKGWDPNEDVKHYIDIDNYPDFTSTGRIKHNFDSLVMQYGYAFVIDQGILPWAIMKTVDSLQTAFQEGNWQKAMLTAADLGHYVGDAYMPLHVTRNYNGQYSGQSGIHSRYESTMINTYQSQITYSGDTVSYVPNVSDFVFEMIYTNYKYVDSVLIADLAAKNFSGGSYNSIYYQKLWELTKNFTIRLYKNASYDLARLIYTAWENAGEPVITNVENEDVLLSDFKLEQNFPNPFNPNTKIRYTIPALTPSLSQRERVMLKVYDIIGNEVATLVDEYKPAGTYEVEFNANNLSSGIYFYKFQADSYVETKRMILLK